MTNPQKVKNDIRKDLQQSTSAGNQFQSQAAGAAGQMTSSLSGTNAQQVKNEIQQDLQQSTSASNQFQAAGATAGGAAAGGAAAAGAAGQMTSSLSGTDAQQVKNEIQQDLSNSSASLGLNSGTNAQKVKNDIQQDLK